MYISSLGQRRTAEGRRSAEEIKTVKCEDINVRPQTMPNSRGELAKWIVGVLASAPGIPGASLVIEHTLGESLRKIIDGNDKPEDLLKVEQFLREALKEKQMEQKRFCHLKAVFMQMLETFEHYNRMVEREVSKAMKGVVKREGRSGYEARAYTAREQAKMNLEVEKAQKQINEERKVVEGTARESERRIAEKAKTILPEKYAKTFAEEPSKPRRRAGRGS